MPSNKKRLDRVERGAVNNRRNLVFNDLGGVLAFAVTLTIKFIKAANSDISFAGEDLVDRTGTEQCAVSGSEAPFVQPHRDFLGAQRPGISVSVSGKVEDANNNLCLDRLFSDFLLLFASDDLSVDRLVAEWNYPAIRISPTRVFLHSAGGRARGLSGLEFIHDTDEFSEHVAARVIGERFGKRNQLNLMLAQRANRQFLFELIPKRARERVDQNGINRACAVGGARNHLFEFRSLHVGGGFPFLAIHANNIIAVAFASRENLLFLIVKAQKIACLGLRRSPGINENTSRHSLSRRKVWIVSLNMFTCHCDHL